jgi:3',5'-cyclic-AMP phosphodiesterase
MELSASQYPRPSHTLVHISDTHLVSGSSLYGAVDSQARLVQILAELEESDTCPEAILFTGDLTDKGEPEAYEKLRALTGPVAQRLGAELIWVPGNHDKGQALRQILLSEDNDPRSAPADDAPLDRVYEINGLRVITLDSTLPGYHHGEVSPDQLDWLTGQLSAPARDGTILALHHPPVPAVQDLAALTELRNQQELAAALRGSDVRLILAGHLHYSAFAVFAGIPVSVASATSYTQDLNAPAGGIRGRDGAQAFNLVHIYDDTVVASVVPAGRYGTVGQQINGEETTKRLAAAGIYIPDPPNGTTGNGRCAEDTGHSPE